MKYTVQNMVRALASLSRDRRYNYVNPGTKGTIEILNVAIPFGPVTIRRSGAVSKSSTNRGKYALSSVSNDIHKLFKAYYVIIFINAFTNIS